MQTYGSVPVYDDYGAVPFPRISPEDRDAALKPLDNRQAQEVESHLDKWRKDNPNAFRTWTTKLGCVIQFWGMRVYYGRCKDCGGLVTDRRSVARYRKGITNIGRWRERCGGCAEVNRQAHEDGARFRMARLRQKRRESRDTQMLAAGMTPPRQGMQAVGKTAAAQSMDDAALLRVKGGSLEQSEVDEIAARYQERLRDRVYRQKAGANRDLYEGPLIGRPRTEEELAAAQSPLRKC
jgi:hypothetical protein